MYLRNCWYVAGWSKDYGRELKAEKYLGENIVIYRREDGTPAALENACPHRKIPLSEGSLKGCLLYTSPSPRDTEVSRMPSSA